MCSSGGSSVYIYMVVTIWSRWKLNKQGAIMIIANRNESGGVPANISAVALQMWLIG